MDDNNPASTVTDNILVAILPFQHLCESKFWNINYSLETAGYIKAALFAFPG